MSLSKLQSRFGSSSRFYFGAVFCLFTSEGCPPFQQGINEESHNSLTLFLSWLSQLWCHFVTHDMTASKQQQHQQQTKTSNDKHWLTWQRLPEPLCSSWRQCTRQSSSCPSWGFPSGVWPPPRGPAGWTAAPAPAGTQSLSQASGWSTPCLGSRPAQQRKPSGQQAKKNLTDYFSFGSRPAQQCKPGVNKERMFNQILSHSQKDTGTLFLVCCYLCIQHEN